MKISSIIAAVFLFILSRNSHALYGAKLLQTDEFDSVVTLHLADPENPKYNFFCSGILIAANKVITTGHCIAELGKEVYYDVHRLPFIPDVVRVKYRGVSYVAFNIEIAPKYFEDAGLLGEDLALVELLLPIPNAKPVALARKTELNKGTALRLVARGKYADTTLKRVVRHPETTVLFTDTSSGGICRGDSGGGLFLKKDGQWKLAGVLIYQGGEDCNREQNLSYFPKEQF